MTKTWCAAALVAVALLDGSAQAAVITQWNFNSVPPDGILTTGTTAPSLGSGSAGLVGGVTATFASGAANGGSSDPAAADNSGWQTTNYPGQGTGDKTAGVQFLVSTTGYANIVVGYDLRHSNTSSRYEQFQYTLDGSNWVDATVFDGNAGDTWFNGRSVDLSSIAGAADNPNFGFRILATFEPGTGQYVPSNSASSYAGTGTWRFDMVTVQGTAVPIPAALPLMLSGLAWVGAFGRNRRSA